MNKKTYLKRKMKRKAFKEARQLSRILGVKKTKRNYGDLLYDEERKNVKTFTSSLREEQLRILGITRSAPSTTSHSLSFRDGDNKKQSTEK